MKDVRILGVDLGKNSCSVVGMDAAEQVVLHRRMRRESIIALAAKLPGCVVATEACCGAHHLGRLLVAQGHEVRLMSPEYVRPYVKAQKNDDRDAETIAKAATQRRPGFQGHVAGPLHGPFDGMDRPRSGSECGSVRSLHSRKGAVAMSVVTIGLDIAKSVFQVHGVEAAGDTVLRRRLGRTDLLPFFAKQPACVIGMEACSSAHHWARELSRLGHHVRLIPPQYVKP